MAVNIGVHNANLEALLYQRCGQVYGHGGFAHTTFTGGHRENASSGIRLCKRDFGLGLAAA